MANDTRTKEIKKLEKYLRNYKTYKIGLKSMKKQMDYMMPSLTATYDLAKTSNSVYQPSSQTEKFAIERVESKRALILKEDISEYNLIVDSIDAALNELDELERKFITLRYIERKTIAKTSVEMGYSEKYIFNLRNQVFDKLLISMRVLLTLSD